jgi:hypothetical protein
MNKQVIWTKGHKIKDFFLFPRGERGGDYVNLLGQIGFVKYYEDVIDPSIHVEISVVDPFGIINQAPVRSGSEVSLKMEHPSQEDPIELKLIVTNIVGHLIDQKREVYTLVCETIGALSNHTTRVFKKYTGSITVSVSDIINEKIKGNINSVDTTSNTLDFYGNYRRPFKVIADLCRKSIFRADGAKEGDEGSAGFLFWESQDGYNFRSIDSIFSDDAKHTYSMTPIKGGLELENNFMLASEPKMRESHDIIKKLRSGTFSTANWYYDVLTRKVTFHNFNYNDHIVKANEEVPIYDGPFSRIMLSTLDQGTTNKDADGVDTLTPQKQAEFQAQASARYSALFSQIIDITVPMNVSLRAGDVLDIQFPNINTDKKTEKNSPESGKYMIARLSHEFGNPDGDFTGLSLVRDSFTPHE